MMPSRANLANEARRRNPPASIISSVKSFRRLMAWPGLAQAQVGDLVGPGSGALTTVGAGQSHPGLFFGGPAIGDPDSRAHALQWPEIARGRWRISRSTAGLTLASGYRISAQGPGAVRQQSGGCHHRHRSGGGGIDNPQNLLSPGMFVRVRALARHGEGCIAGTAVGGDEHAGPVI